MIKGPKGQTEIDLVEEVKNILIKNGITEDRLLAYDMDNYVNLARSQPPQVQRYYLNNHLTLLLIELSNNVTAEEEIDEARLNLIPDGEIEDWLRCFETKVLPVLLKYAVYPKVQ